MNGAAIHHRCFLFGTGAQQVFTQMGFLDDRRGSMIKVEDDGDGEMMRHRQHPEHAVAGADAQALVGGGDALEQRLVGEQHALGFSGGAGAEADKGGVQRFESVAWEARVGSRRHLGDDHGLAVDLKLAAALRLGRKPGGGRINDQHEVQGGAGEKLAFFLLGKLLRNGDEAGACGEGGQGERHIVEAARVMHADAEAVDASCFHGEVRPDLIRQGVGALKQFLIGE